VVSLFLVCLLVDFDAENSVVALGEYKKYNKVIISYEEGMICVRKFHIYFFAVSKTQTKKCETNLRDFLG